MFVLEIFVNLKTWQRSNMRNSFTPVRAIPLLSCHSHSSTANSAVFRYTDMFLFSVHALYLFLSLNNRHNDVLVGNQLVGNDSREFLPTGILVEVLDVAGI